MIIGYARVSKATQNMSLQIDALNKAGCSKIYQDSASGITSNRPGLIDALEYIREGDQLVVWRMDRLGRTLLELIHMVKDMGKKGIEFRSLSEEIDTTTSTGKLLFHLSCSFCQHETDVIRERTFAGLESARARGRFGGRRYCLDEKQTSRMMVLYNKKNMQIKEICELFKISDKSFYNYKKRYEEKQRSLDD